MRQASHSGLTDGRTLIGKVMAQKQKSSLEPELGGEPEFLTQAEGRATLFLHIFRTFACFSPISATKSAFSSQNQIG